jgi:predicted RNase H-like nuclease
MTVILAIDAAWTSEEPSGVALVAWKDGVWKSLCVAPSYATFVACSEQISVNWDVGHFQGSKPDIPGLLAAARTICMAEVDLVVLDLPISMVPFSGRRTADNAISIAFGGFGCSAHSPSLKRPGQLSREVMSQLHNAGYPLATSKDVPGTLHRALETYPHPALLHLLRRNYRVPYKVSRSRRYWPNLDIRARIEKLLIEFAVIQRALSNIFVDIRLNLPCVEDVRTLKALKRYEDMIDGLVCAWVGARYVERTVKPYGDATAAIWVPDAND